MEEGKIKRSSLEEDRTLAREAALDFYYKVTRDNHDKPKRWFLLPGNKYDPVPLIEKATSLGEINRIMENAWEINVEGKSVKSLRALGMT